MAYIINRFDGTQLTIVDDGILDTSTPVGLIGRNYTGYGEVQNENFIFLLENFANDSPPARALSGQAWYDKTAKTLKVFNGTGWLSIGNATVAETEPLHSNGGLWLKTATQQLFVSDGTVWRQVGPEAAEGFAVTKMTSTKIKSLTGAFYPVILTQINGVTTAIHSDNEFTISADEAVPGFSVIYPGLNYPTTGVSTSSAQTIETLTITGAGDSRFNVTLYYRGLVSGLSYPVWSSSSTSTEPLFDTITLIKTSGVQAYILNYNPENISYTSTTFPANPEDIRVSDWYQQPQGAIGYAALPGPSIGRSISTTTVSTIVSKYALTGDVRGNAETASQLKNVRTINGVPFNGTGNITVTAATDQPLKPGDYIVGSDFNGSFEQTWNINAESENILGTVVARNSVGGFSATTINSDLFGNVQGNVTALSGTSTFNNLVANVITAPVIDGNAATATKIRFPKKINTIDFDGSADITLPVPANTLTTDTLAINVVNSSLTTLGKLEYLEVEAPGIIVGDGNNLNIRIEGFTPTLESDVSNAIKLKLATGSVTIAPTTVTFISANAANADGVLSPALVPDYTLSTAANQRPVLGLPSHRWRDIYSAAATLDNLKTSTISGRTLADQVTFTKDVIVTGNTYGNVIGNLTGNVVGNLTGAASLNLLKSGDTMSGDIFWNTTGRGLQWSMNSDSASIRYYNTGDGDTNSRLEFNTGDNTNEFFRWTHTVGASTYESMRLTPNASGAADLNITGTVNVSGNINVSSGSSTFQGRGSGITDLNAFNLASGTVPAARLSGNYAISVTGNVIGNVTGNLQGAVTGNVTGNVTGSASLNVLKTGDTLSGDINWSTTGRGLTWGMNSDGASIRFYNISDGDTASRLEFQTTDNGNEYFSWTQLLSGGSTIEAMRLVPNTVNGTSSLRVYGNITVDGTASGTFSGTGTNLDINAEKLVIGTLPRGRLSGTYDISISGNANYATSAGSATANIQRSGDTMTGRLGQHITGFHAASIGDINTRTNSGFFDNPAPTTAGGWPVTGSWYHLLSSTHVNDSNYYAMQLSADFYGQNLYYRSTAGNGATAWSKILHSNNYNDYAPTKTGGGASGTWPISINGQSNTVANLPSSQIINSLGYTPVNPGVLTNQAGTAISGTTASFTGQVSVSTSGIKFPNDAFGGGGDAATITLETKGGEATTLALRVTNDADDTIGFFAPSNNGVTINNNIVLHAANYNSYAPSLAGSGATGTWSISINGNANSASSVAWGGISGKPSIVYNDGAQYGINISGTALNATTSTQIYNRGNVTAESDGTGEPSSALTLRSVYNNGYPTQYGNAITLGGAGGGELLVGWSGTTGAHADNYVRSRRDTGNTWSAWAKLITDVNYNSYAPSLTGTGASGTWSISINGNAATVTTVTSGQIAAGLGFSPISKSGDNINGDLNLQDYNLKRPTIIDYSLAHNSLNNVSGSTTIDLELGNYASATAVGAVTWTFANPPTGARAGSLILELTNGGAYTQYWPASVRWPSGSAPTLTASGVDVLVFITDDGGSNWRAAITMANSR